MVGELYYMLYYSPGSREIALKTSRLNKRKKRYLKANDHLVTVLLGYEIVLSPPITDKNNKKRKFYDYKPIKSRRDKLYRIETLKRLKIQKKKVLRLQARTTQKRKALSVLKSK